MSLIAAPPTDLGTPRRWGVFAVGLAALVTGIALMVRAGLGVGSWQVLETGLVALTGAPFGVVALVESLVVLAIAWALLGQRPWIATAVLSVAGVAIGALLEVLPTPAGLLQQVAMLAAGIPLLTVGVAFYLASDFGASAQDALFVGLYTRFRLRPGRVRLAVDGTIVVLGTLIGGQIGVGTAAVTVALPLLIEPALRVGHHLAATPLPASMIPTAAAVPDLRAVLDDAAR